MNEEVTNKANEVLLKMLEGVEKGSEFVVEKAPEVVQQLLTWEFVYSLTTFIAAAISLLGLSFLAFKHARDSTDRETWFGRIVYATDGFIYLFYTLAFIPCFFVSAIALDITWLKILLAPDLYLLEYAAKLVN